MTTQEKKAYLRQYRAIKNEVDYLKCEIEEIKDLRRSLSGIDYGKDRVQSTPSDNLINSICTQEKLEERLSKKINEGIARLDDISKCVDVMANPSERAILRYKYFTQMTWEDIASKMYISRTKVISIHGTALKNFAVRRNS